MATQFVLDDTEKEILRTMANGTGRYRRGVRGNYHDPVVLHYTRGLYRGVTGPDKWTRKGDASPWVFNRMVKSGLVTLDSDGTGGTTGLYSLTNDGRAAAVEAQRLHDETEAARAERKAAERATRQAAQEAAQARREREAAAWVDALHAFIMAASPAQVVSFITSTRQRGGLGFDEAPTHIGNGMQEHATIDAYRAAACVEDDARREAYRAAFGHYPGEG